MVLAIELTDEMVEAIAQRAAAIVEERLAPASQKTEVDDYVDADVAAARLRVTRDYIWRLVRTGKLDGRKVGGRVWVSAAAVERRVQGERVQPRPSGATAAGAVRPPSPATTAGTRRRFR